MGWLTGQDKGIKARDEPRRPVRKCIRHGNAEPCWKCKAVDKQAAAQARKTGVDPRPTKCSCGRTKRGGICPGPFC